jgi:hypothetical protein
VLVAVVTAVSLFAQADTATVPPASPAAAAPAAVTTPWPTELPCPRPRALWFNDKFDGTVVWSSDDGRETRSFTAAESSAEQRLPRDFPVGRLTRLAGGGVAADLKRDAVGVECRANAGISWGPCQGGACAVSVSYLAEVLPKAKQRTRRWTDEIPGSPWGDIAPEVHWTRFLRDVAQKEKADPARARAVMRFSRAFAIELRDLLAGACGRRRCAAPARDADKALGAYLRDPAPVHGNASEKEVDHWNYVWSWTATGGGVTLRLSCDDLVESRDLLCDLSVDLPGDLTLLYSTMDRTAELYPKAGPNDRDPVGRIADVSPDRGPPRVMIEGRFIELVPAAPASPTAPP